MGKFLKLILFIYGFIANLITYITGINQLKDLANDYIPLWCFDLIIIGNVLLFVVLFIYGSSLLLIYITLPYRKSIGTHGIECELYNMFVYRWLVKNEDLLRIVHAKLYHQTYQIREQIRCGHITNRGQFQDKVRDLIQIAGTEINNLFRLRLTVNVKVLSYTSDNSLVLTPFVHMNAGVHKGERHRDFHYNYLIQCESCSDVKMSTGKAKEYSKRFGNDKYKVNNIFNYLLNNKNSYWISNNLEIEFLSDNFFTSSDNYPMYYKSMAVFKIAPPEKDIIPEGFVIFDTDSTGRFSEKECIQLMGYIAHLLYELFLEFTTYEEKSEKLYA